MLAVGLWGHPVREPLSALTPTPHSSPSPLTRSGPADFSAAQNPFSRALEPFKGRYWASSFPGSLCPQSAQQDTSSSPVVTGELERFQPNPSPSWDLNVPSNRKQAQCRASTPRFPEQARTGMRDPPLIDYRFVLGAVLKGPHTQEWMC